MLALDTGCGPSTRHPACGGDMSENNSQLRAVSPGLSRNGLKHRLCCSVLHHLRCRQAERFPEHVQDSDADASRCTSSSPCDRLPGSLDTAEGSSEIVSCLVSWLVGGSSCVSWDSTLSRQAPANQSQISHSIGAIPFGAFLSYEQHVKKFLYTETKIENTDTARDINSSYLFFAAE